MLGQNPPAGLLHWDGPTVPEQLQASVHAVWRVLRKEGICIQALQHPSGYVEIDSGAVVRAMKSTY